MRPFFGWLNMYTYPYGFFQVYNCHNNEFYLNYIMWRNDVKDAQQDVFIVIQTSAHCYTVTHYCLLDGFNEVQRFKKLYDVAQYLIQAMWDYDQKYAEWLLEQETLRRERRLKKLEKERARAERKKEYIGTTSEVVKLNDLLYLGSRH